MTPPLLSPEANPRHLVIKASAGSGKTFRLSTLYIVLLAQGFPPESILATTFTRKAAGEIMERVLRRLAGAARDSEGAARLARELSEDLHVAVELPLERVRELLGRFCGVLHRVQISTLDRFFNRLARSFRLELGLPAEPVILDDRSTAAGDLRREAIACLLADDPIPATFEILASLQEENPCVAIEKTLDALMEEMRGIRIESRSAAWERLAPVGRRLAEPEIETLASDLGSLAATAGGKLLAAAAAKAAAATRRRDWAGALESGPAAKIANGEAKYGKTMITDPLLEPFHRLVAHAAAELTDALARQTLATRDLLDRFEERFTRLAARRRVLFFADLPRLLGQALEEETELAGEIGYRLDGRVRQILLDEFQDTSPAQWRVLRPLAAEIVAHGPPSASGRGFFCVGDVKQAIYGWRGGVAGVMDAARDDLGLTAANEDRMDWSWRSAQVVLDAVHAIFQSFDGNRGLAQWPVIARRWREAVERHVAKRELAGHVELITSGAADGEEEGDEESLSHFEFAARRIREMVRARPDHTVGVLVARNRTAQDLLLRLQRLGVPASGESGNPLDHEPAVGVILAALTLAERPGDTIAAWRLLYSPLRGHHGLDSMDERARCAFSRAIREGLASEGLAAVVGELAGIVAPASDGSAAARLERLVAMAGAFPDPHPLLPGEFVRLVREKSVEESSASRVRVMNVHKAKGLEFDIVVLPELQKKIGETTARLLVEREHPLGPITAVMRSGRPLHRALHPMVRSAHAQETARRLEDDLAWLYVALTRARQALTMIIPPLGRKKGGAVGTRGYTDSTHATIVRAALSRLGENERAEGDEILFAAGDRAWEKPAVIRNESAAVSAARFGVEGIDLAVLPAIPSRGMKRIAPASYATIRRLRLATAIEKQGVGGLEAGTLVHAWFERVEWSDDFTENDATLLAVGRAVACGMEEGAMRAWLGRFRGWLKEPRIASALARPDCAASETLDPPWRERAFTVRIGEELLHGRFDRVVVVRRGPRPVRAILTDFKTDHVADASDVALKAEEYAPQIEAYRRALERLLGLEPNAIEARLLFPGIGVTAPAAVPG